MLSQGYVKKQKVYNINQSFDINSNESNISGSCLLDSGIKNTKKVRNTNMFADFSIEKGQNEFMKLMVRFDKIHN